MTKEEKRLLLQDLSARLLYGVIVRLDYRNGTIVTREMGIGSFHDMLFDNAEGKPYLRPISSMTEEEIKEYEKLCIIYDTSGTVLFDINGLNWFNVHHLDYRGLIEKGLAIEAPEGMYKN